MSCTIVCPQILGELSIQHNKPTMSSSPQYGKMLKKFQLEALRHLITPTSYMLSYCHLRILIVINLNLSGTRI